MSVAVILFALTTAHVPVIRVSYYQKSLDSSAKFIPSLSSAAKIIAEFLRDKHVCFCSMPSRRAAKESSAAQRSEPAGARGEGPPLTRRWFPTESLHTWFGRKSAHHFWLRVVGVEASRSTYCQESSNKAHVHLCTWRFRGAS